MMKEKTQPGVKCPRCMSKKVVLIPSSQSTQLIYCCKECWRDWPGPKRSSQSDAAWCHYKDNVEIQKEWINEHKECSEGKV